MITFFSKADYSCKSSGNVSSSDGWRMILPGPCTSDPTALLCRRMIRSPKDFIMTSKETYFAGDKVCTHRQFEASFVAPYSQLTGLDVRAASFNEYKSSLLLRLNSKWAVPANGKFFVGSEMTGGKAYCTASHAGFISGTGSQVSYVLLPGQSDTWDISYCTTTESVWQRFVFSTVVSRGFSIMSCERFQLTRTKTSTGWTSSDYNSWTSSFTWYVPLSTNSIVGLTTTGISYGLSVVPTKRYPGGVKPTLAHVIADMENTPIDQYGFKGMLAAYLDASYLARAGMYPLTVKFAAATDYASMKAQADLIGHATELLSLQYGGTTSELDWASLADTCIDHCRAIDINGLAYIKEGIAGIMDVISAIKRGELPKPTSIPDLWLSARYGLRLTANDTASIVDAAKQAVKQVSRDFSVARARKDDVQSVRSAAVRKVTRSLRYKLYYNRIDDPVLNVLRSIADWDLWPSAANIWDLIPYSFVADWFVDIQGQLESIDNSQYQQFLTILSVLYTEKWTYDLEPSLFSSPTWICQQASMTYYHRRHSPTPHYAPLRLGGGHASNINWVDGAMLVLQKTKL